MLSHNMQSVWCNRMKFLVLKCSEVTYSFYDFSSIINGIVLGASITSCQDMVGAMSGIPQELFPS